ARPHERFVVKPGRNEGGDEVIHGSDVEIQTGPAVLTLRLQALVQLNLGGSQIGRITSGITPYGDQCVGFFGTGGKNSTRPMVFEGSAHQMHAIGEQRRGERVACKASVRASIKGEVQHPRTVDPASSGRAQAATVHAHGRSPTL